MTELNRRKLLKNVTIGTGAVVAGKALPESWSKPVVDSVLLPAHGATTDAAASSTTSRVCCAGVFCNLDFGDNPFFGNISVSSDCTISMKGSIAKEAIQAYSGSGTVASDGSFSFNIAVDSNPNLTDTISGSVSSDCSTISGKAGDTAFSGSVTPGATSLDECKVPCPPFCQG